MTSLAYFSEDGNYGTADCVLLVTDQWTEEDWNEIEDCADYERMSIALDISKKYE